MNHLQTYVTLIQHGEAGNKSLQQTTIAAGTSGSDAKTKKMMEEKKKAKLD